MTDAVDKTLRLLKKEVPKGLKSEQGITLPSRQDVARKAVKDALAAAAEIVPRSASKPVLRTLHHLACTGGTLFSKSVSAQPNVTLLSEVDPFSPMGSKHLFRPTDVIGLARIGPRAAGLETQAKVFKASLAILVQENSAHGTYLVLRDHSHSKYNYGDDIGSYPGLRAFLSDSYDLRSAVTVRDPIDSYLSLKKNGWVHFLPANFDEYCRRMLVFLDDHADVPIIRYEDFVTDSQQHGAALCDALQLPFNPDFLRLMPAITLSGDSGRKGAKIALRPRRPIPDDLIPDLKKSDHHARLAKRLGYSTDLDGSQ